MEEHSRRSEDLMPADRFDRYPLLLILLFFICLIFLFRPGFLLDSYAYYDFTRSIIFDGDINFYNERAFSPSPLHFGIRTETGFTNNIFPIGTGAVWLPPVYLFHKASRLMETGQSGEAYPGYSSGYLLTVGLTSAFFTLCGLLLLYVFLRHLFMPGYAFLATGMLFLGSPLLAFTFILPSFSHAISFFSVIFFLILVQRYRGEYYKLLLMGLAGGLMVIVRLQNALFLLFPLLYLYPYRDRKHPGYWKILLFTGGFVIVFFPQVITWKILNGSFFALHSAGEDMSVLHTWSDPALFQQLFNLRLGLFAFTPVIFLSVLGLFWGIRHQHRLFLCGAFLFLLILYLNSTKADWYGMGGYGARRFISVIPFFAAGFAWFLSTLSKKKKWMAMLIITIGFYGCLKNLASMIAFSAGSLKTETISLLSPLAAVQTLYLSVLDFPGLAEFLDGSYFIKSFASLVFAILLLFVCILTFLALGMFNTASRSAQARTRYLSAPVVAFFLFLSLFLIYARCDSRSLYTVDCLTVEKRTGINENTKKARLKEKLGRAGVRGKVARRQEKSGTVLPLVLRTDAPYEGISRASSLSPGAMLDLHLNRTVRTDFLALVLAAAGDPGPFQKKLSLTVILNPGNGDSLTKSISISPVKTLNRVNVQIPLHHIISLERIKIQNLGIDLPVNIYGLSVEKRE